jgi:hypothetical protein
MSDELDDELPHIESCPQKTDPTADCACEVNGVYRICVVCRQQFSKDEVRGIDKCDGCGTTMPPIHPSGFVDVRIHWYELQMLSCWAEKFVLTYERYHPQMKDALYAMTEQLELQHPFKHPLTVARQLGEMLQRNPSMTLDDDSIKPIMPKGSLQ